LLRADAPETAIAKQLDRIEAVRSLLSKDRTLMLVRMWAIMTPDERVRLRALREQWEKDHPILLDFRGASDNAD
jgi:hypothetical protein